MTRATQKSDSAKLKTFREEDEDKVRATATKQLALWITQRVGTMIFFGMIFIWTVSWLLWNTLAPKAMRFDPYPGFVLWLFISNMIQLFLMPLLLIGQNMQGQRSEERAKNDYKVNRKAEKEIEEIQNKLEMILTRLDTIQSATK
jgi:uncharacterized membrane protein